MHRLTMLTVFFITLSYSANIAQAKNEEILVSRQTIKIENRVSFVDKTLKEWNSDEGKSITAAVGAVATFFGLDPTYLTAAAYANRLYQDKKRSTPTDYYFKIKSPKGYTMCSAKPTDSKGEYRGVESSRDSTFNSTILRKKSGGGELRMYAAVPPRTKVTTRAMSTFDIVYFRTDVWRKNKNIRKKCQVNKSHPWLSRNNQTRLNVIP